MVKVFWTFEDIKVEWLEKKHIYFNGLKCFRLAKDLTWEGWKGNTLIWMDNVFHTCKTSHVRGWSENTLIWMDKVFYICKKSDFRGWSGNRVIWMVEVL